MTCIKTGCHIYLVQYGVYAYGDAHQVKDKSTGGINIGSYFFRLVETANMPLQDVLHFEVDDTDSWWDRDASDRGSGVSTLVAPFSGVISYGYEGRPIGDFPDFPKGARE